MAVLAVRHIPFEHLGLIAAALDSEGIDYSYLDLYRNSRPPVSPDSFDGLILMGGPMSANDKFDYIGRELQLIEEAVAASKPILGVCLGAPLIAKAAGARVYGNPVKEIGWAPVYWTEAARSDRLLEGLAAPETVFHWHGETFDLPAGAEWLASSDACRNQAFRLGDSAYGFQFHLEVTPEMISDWVQQDLNCGDVRELDVLPDPYANAARLDELARLVFGRWCGLVKSASQRA